MGSSGNTFLGGELITLKLFLVLKAIVADKLLILSQNSNNQLDEIVTSLGEPFRNKSKYIPGSLVNKVISLLTSEEMPTPGVEALEKIEMIVPTRFRNKAEFKNLQNFYGLWALAEKAKIKLSSSQNDYSFTESEIKSFLEGLITSLPAFKLDDITVELTDILISYNSFIEIAKPIIDKAIKLAKGLAESRLLGSDNDESQDIEQIDWLILSGQTSNLSFIKDSLLEIFNQSSIKWNRRRITFDPQYAKIATSLGACYAQRMLEFSFDPLGAKTKLAEGRSELYFKVRNLLFSLPCAFNRAYQGGYQLLFDVDSPLYLCDGDQFPKARSPWLPIQSTTAVYRQDFVGLTQKLWASLNIYDYANTVGKYVENDETSLSGINVQFEVDSNLLFTFYVVKGNPTYLIDESIECINITRSLREISASEHVDEISEVKDEISVSEHVDEVSEVKDEISTSEHVDELSKNLFDKLDISLFSNGELQWDIVIGVLEGTTTVLFQKGDRLDSIFINPTSKPTDKLPQNVNNKGMISSISPMPVARGQTHNIYAIHPHHEKLALGPIHVGKFEFKNKINGFAKDSNGSDDTANYLVNNNTRPYQFTLDYNGNIRLHEGLVPYYQTESLDDLSDDTSYVYSIKSEALGENDDITMNPFSGIH